MASAKLIAILRARSAPFSDDELAALSDADGWKWLYSHFPPKHSRPKPKAGDIEICFTGFGDVISAQLAAEARAAGMFVRTAVTLNLDFLCTGPNAGPSKLAKAAELKVQLLTVDQFRELLRTGEMPSLEPLSGELALRDYVIAKGEEIRRQIKED